MTSEFLQKLNVVQLVEYIQPRWNKYNKNLMNSEEINDMKIALETYEKKGGDLDYFIHGSGAPDNCIVC